MKTPDHPAFESSGTGAMPRRDFLRRVAAASSVAGAALTTAGVQQAAPSAAPATASAAKGPRNIFCGIQMSPHSMLDEGIEKCLDLIQETAAVNCIMVYSHAYGGNMRKPLRDLANDHGVPAHDNTQRKLPIVWVKTHEQYYGGTTLRHQKVDDSFDYHDRDLFAELAEPCRKRGIKLYARILEAGSQSIANFAQSVTVDVNGRRTGTACWNNPNCKNLWAGTAEDLFRTYQLDGFQWGAERMGPLMNVISPWSNPIPAPTCFCDHCRARGKAKGIDSERARLGFLELWQFCQNLPNQPKPADGIFAGFLRVLLRYPEILAWEYQYRLAREEVQQAMYDKIKSIRPDAQVGWHVDHQPSSWDLVYRAEMSYEEMAPWSDFIKIIVYHSVLGPRIRDWYLPRFKRTVLGELSLEQSLDLYYTLFNYDKSAEPKLAELGRKGFSAEYVFRETQHSVASANGKTKIYSGVGFDVPGSPRDDEETVYQTVMKSFAAGAGGVVLSREYEEMRVPNLKAAGRAVRELAKG
jgi:hypothetical protein